jgi:hypothetical protein
MLYLHDLFHYVTDYVISRPILITINRLDFDHPQMVGLWHWVAHILLVRKLRNVLSCLDLLGNFPF